MQNVNKREYMRDRIIILVIVFLSAMVLVYTDFGNQTRVYDCTGNLNSYPKEVIEECKKLIDEYHRHHNKKDSKIYI